MEDGTEVTRPHQSDDNPGVSTGTVMITGARCPCSTANRCMSSRYDQISAPTIYMSL